VTIKPTYEELERRIRELEKAESERNLAHEQQIKSHDLLSNLARLVPGVIYQYRLYVDGRSAFPYASPGMNDIYEVTPEEVREDATPVYGRLHPEDYDKVIEAIQESARTLQTFYCEFRVILPRQGLRWRWSQAHPEGMADGSTLWHGIISDITERKLANEALAYSHDLMRYVIEHANSAIAVHDRELRYVYVSQRYLNDYNIKERDIIGKHHYEVFPDLPQRWREVHRKALAGEVCGADRDPYPREDGTVDWTRWECRPWYKADGSIGGIIVYTEVITDRVHAEEALREKGEHQRAIIAASTMAIITLDPDGRVRSWNVSAERIFGWAEEEVLGKMLPVVQENQQEVFTGLRRKVMKGEASSQVELTRRRKDGSLIEISLSTAPLRDKEGQVNGIMSVIEDIADRKKAEKEKEKLNAQLIQAQKMESIGNLAGGIAHDFNNILSPIMLHAEMAIMDLPTESRLQMNMKQIYQAGERAKDLVQQILTFARVKEKEKVPLRASLIVKEAIKFLRATIPSTIDVQYEFKTDRDTVLADPTQIHQIIMNLCTNAFHAMQANGGRLKVILTDEDLGPDETSRFVGILPGHYLRMSVSDTGAGIPPDIVDKIFDPYFSTKGPGHGTGLGLAVIHGIVKDCRGHIAVESEIGKGSIFHILLPIAEEEAPTIRDQKGELPKGNERILFVDDEKSTADAIQVVLQRLGYKVTARTSSIEAFEAFRNNPGGFDLVITDMTMPNMTGKDLAMELMAIRPDIPVILCTGFSEQIGEKRAKEIGIRAFVMKPIVMSQIANTIREVLDRK